MKKLSLIIILFLGVLTLERCRKDTITETATSTNTLFATLNDTTWSADTITASLAYNSATGTKVFKATGIADNKEVNIQVTMTSVVNSAGIPLLTFTSNGSSTTFSYATSEKNSAGVVTWYPQGIVAAGSGTLNFSSVDSVKHQVSGTFSFTATQNNYDANGNVVSVTFNEASDGAFNSLPYTFTSN
jgi:hypothetical protein